MNNNDNVSIAIQLLISLLANAERITQLIVAARTENRDISEAELNELVAADEVARNNLQAAINAP